MFCCPAVCSLAVILEAVTDLALQTAPESAEYSFPPECQGTQPFNTLL